MTVFRKHDTLAPLDVMCVILQVWAKSGQKISVMTVERGLGLRGVGTFTFADLGYEL